MPLHPRGLLDLGPAQRNTGHFQRVDSSFVLALDSSSHSRQSPDGMPQGWVRSGQVRSGPGQVRSGATSSVVRSCTLASLIVRFVLPLHHCVFVPHPAWLSDGQKQGKRNRMQSTYSFLSVSLTHTLAHTLSVCVLFFFWSRLTQSSSLDCRFVARFPISGLGMEENKRCDVGDPCQARPSSTGCIASAGLAGSLPCHHTAGGTW